MARAGGREQGLRASQAFLPSSKQRPRVPVELCALLKHLGSSTEAALVTQRALAPG